MAPAFSRSGARSGRTNRNAGFDHDIVEGLPIRHWRRDNVTVAPPPHPDLVAQQNDKWAIELPYGMPKDSHLLPLHSQELLRAARSGRLYKRTVPAEEEEVEAAEPPAEKAEKLEKKEEEIEVKGFTARTWKQVPKHLEGSEFEYLAARRKGLLNPAKTTTRAGAPEPALTKATVRRTDASGNTVVENLVLKEGEYVLNGEILAQTVIPNPVVSETPKAAATPVKKKPPPPKRKAKGPGRGRKKKVQIIEGADGTGAAVASEKQAGAPQEDVTKTEPSTQNITDSKPDTKMKGQGENGGHQSDDDEGDEEDDEEGDEETPVPAPNPPLHSAPPVTKTQTPILPPPKTVRPSAVTKAMVPVGVNNIRVPSPLKKTTILPPQYNRNPIVRDAPLTTPPKPPVQESMPIPAPEFITKEHPNLTSTTQGEKQENQDTMLLDTDISNVPEVQQPFGFTASAADYIPQQIPEVPKETQPAPEPTAPATSQGSEGDDGFIDLLGNLEKSLAENYVGKDNISAPDEVMQDAPAPVPEETAMISVPAPDADPASQNKNENESKVESTFNSEIAPAVHVVEEPSTQTYEVTAELEWPAEPVVEVAAEVVTESRDSVPESITEPGPVPSGSADIKVDVEVKANAESAPESASVPVVAPGPPAQLTETTTESVSINPTIEYELPAKLVAFEPTGPMEYTEFSEPIAYPPVEKEEEKKEDVVATGDASA